MVRGHDLAAAWSISASVVVRPSVRRSDPRRLLLGIAQRGQDVRRIGRARRARRAGRDRDALQVERPHQCVALGVASDDRQVAGQALARMAGQLDARHCQDGVAQPVALRGQTRHDLVPLSAQASS